MLKILLPFEQLINVLINDTKLAIKRQDFIDIHGVYHIIWTLALMEIAYEVERYIELFMTLFFNLHIENK